MDESERLIVVAALGAPAPAAEAWRRWKATVPIAQATGLLTWAGGYIYRNLAAAGIDEPYLAGIYRHNLIANVARLRAALPALAALTARGPLAPLKSFGMTADTHARGLRPLADVDIWLPMDVVHDAIELLEKAGYSPLLDIADREFTHRVLPQRGSWNFLDRNGIDIDLHWRLLDHLDDSTSRQLVKHNSSIATSEYGEVRQLNDELMLCCLVAHFALDGSLFSHGLFDIAHLLGRVEPGRTAALAAELEVGRELNGTIAALRDLLDEVPASFESVERALAPSAAVQAVPMYVNPPRFGERLHSRYDESPYLARPRLYRLWTALGRPAWLERLVCRWGGFTRSPRPGEDEPQVHPTEVGVLGPGWHYRYPGDDYRWANLPDARVLFADVPESADRVRIELSSAWPGSGPDFVEVRANGSVLGVVDRTTGVAEFPIVASRRIELSLRPPGDRRWAGTGIFAQTYRLLAPVRSIELL